MTTRSRHIETNLIHAGEPHPRTRGAIIEPIFQSAMFEYSGESSYHDLRYIRLNNTPNHHTLHGKLAALEGGETALVTSSGMAAITTTLLTILESGDHLLAQACLYGGTQNFLHEDLPKLGIEVDYIDATDPASWEAKRRPKTKAIYVEAMTNPLLEIADHRAVVAFARAHGLVSLIDATFASPVNYRACEEGYALALHSCTKYLNGHSDIVAGAIVGTTELVERVRHKLNHLGGSLDPHACFLLNRGMKTLALRVRHQNQSAQAIAEFLEGHAAVERVNYPGLPSHPHHARAQELFEGFGGVLSFELKEGLEAADEFIARTSLAAVAPSLGGVETLVVRPAAASHAGVPSEIRVALGIREGLVRVSVGIEATDDLIDDFARALS